MMENKLMCWPFSKPTCPYCGCKTIVPTGYSIGYPQYRCTNKYCPSKGK